MSRCNVDHDTTHYACDCTLKRLKQLEALAEASRDFYSWLNTVKTYERGDPGWVLGKQLEDFFSDQTK